MGTVYAKSALQNKDFKSVSKHSTMESKPLNLEEVKVRVDKVHIDGLKRTKDDIVKAQVTELFNAHDFQDVVLKAHNVRAKLEALGCFKNIGIYIDTSQGPDATPEGVEVTFIVNEMKRLMGGIKTTVGNNEGSLMIGATAPNMFGRAERIQMEYSYSNKNSTNFNVSIIKPIYSNRLQPIFTGSVFNASSEYPSSGYKQCDYGFLIDLAFNSIRAGALKHKFQYEAVIRELSTSKQVAFTIREQCGFNLKSALKYICSIDKRNETIFPSYGSLLQLTSELAGLGGDIGFLKNEFLFQNNWLLLENIILQLGFQFGLMRGINNDLKINIADRFFLGGPLNIRGFETRSCGPCCDGDFMGGEIYWALGLHIYTPLPFRPGGFSSSDMFRLHGFINGGNLSNFTFKLRSTYEENIKMFTKDFRLSFGAGVAMKLGNVARVELNFIIPYKIFKTDVFRQFQFGIGLQYL
ncbi:sorting and assembly machinery component 50 homolog B [Prorops nasuta]|uniref:sorting and assembly machinery component 50 homolog B n=1 Tax=Prorops nasuta TaxID=863751 RepID=UPI0034CEB5C0